MYRVLIVEDEDGYQLLYKRMEAWGKCGFVIADTAEHGAEALRKLEKESFDLVFSDIRMPVMDGIEMLKSIRESGKTDLPIVFASSHSDFSYAQQGFVYGLFDYLLKPVDEKAIENLLCRVKRSLSGRENKADKTVSEVLSALGLHMETDDFVYHIAVYCSEHYKEPFVLSSFADLFGYSNDHFSQLFRQHFGIGFKDFSNRVKVAYAIEYLHAGTHTFNEISELLGYAKVDHFRDVFKTVTGVRPSDYKFGAKGGVEA